MSPYLRLSYCYISPFLFLIEGKNLCAVECMYGIHYSLFGPDKVHCTVNATKKTLQNLPGVIFLAECSFLTEPDLPLL